MLAEGKAGKKILNSGALVELRLGPTGALVQQDGHARYYETTRNGDCYTAIATAVTIAATHVSPATANTGTPIIGLFNPANSGKNLSLIALDLQTISGTPGGPFYWNVIPAPCGITAAGTAGLNSASFAAGGVAKVFGNAATTGSLAGTVFRVLGGPAAIAAGAGIYSVEDEVAGSIIIPPGAFAGVYAKAVGTTHIVDASIVWEEVTITT
jgi:hypothetical protein